jgi:mRNA interferase RelE/StbE
VNKNPWEEKFFTERGIPNFLKRDERVLKQGILEKVLKLFSALLVPLVGVVVFLSFVVAFPVVYIIRIINTLRYNKIARDLVEIQQQINSLNVELFDVIEQYLIAIDQIQITDSKNSCRSISREIVELTSKKKLALSRLDALDSGVTAAFRNFLRTSDSFALRSLGDGVSSAQLGSEYSSGPILYRRNRKRAQQPLVTTVSEAGKWDEIYNKSFVKKFEKLEGDLQQRIIFAIKEILTEPASPKGDTLKRLTGNHKGLWRCRVGDVRLIYMPEINDKTVIFLDIGKRDEIYDKYLH